MFFHVTHMIFTPNTFSIRYTYLLQFLFPFYTNAFFNYRVCS